MKTFRPLNQNLISHPMEVSKQFKISKNDKILAMGGCFTLNMADYLRKIGYCVFNQENEIEPKLIWYNTYTILYEFQRLTGEFKQDDNDVWQINSRWQDPYRRLVYEPTKEKLMERIRSLDRMMDKYIRSSNCIIITLSLIEVFFNNGRGICAIPGYGNGGGEGAEFRLVDYDENLLNVRKIMQIISSINPSCKVIFNISVVPIAKTFTEEDHMIANTEGLCILRSVAGRICREYANAYYFPAYEHVLHQDRKDIYIEDARHIQDKFIKVIMDDFVRIFT